MTDQISCTPTYNLKSALLVNDGWGKVQGQKSLIPGSCLTWSQCVEERFGGRKAGTSRGCWTFTLADSEPGFPQTRCMGSVLTNSIQLSAGNQAAAE